MEPQLQEPLMMQVLPVVWEWEGVLLELEVQLVSLGPEVEVGGSSLGTP